MAHSQGLPRIAIVDHHDSYTRNLLSLLCASVDPLMSPESLAHRVVIIPYTHPALAPDNVHDQFLPYVDAIILSPGPGNPMNDEDFGSSTRLLQNPALVQVPVLGICLGHQGIATSSGASIRQLSEPFHGRKRALCIENAGHTYPDGMKSIMAGIPNGTEVICYNSLVVDETTLPANVRVVAHSELSDSNEVIVQAIEHTELPYYGIQYHPESIESAEGHTVLQNFLHNVGAYWRKKDPARVQFWAEESHVSMMSRAAFTLLYDMNANLTLCCQREDASVEQSSLSIDMESLWDWMNDLQWDLQQQTALPQEADAQAESAHSCNFPAGFAGFWSYEMKDESLALGALRAERYEKKLGDAAFDRLAFPAAHWAFCNTVLTLDHATGKWIASALVRNEDVYAMMPGSSLASVEQTLAQMGTVSIGVSECEAHAWFTEVQDALKEICAVPEPTIPRKAAGLAPLNAVDNRTTYMEKIRKAKDYIAHGESYELCLTTQFEGQLPLDTHNYDGYFDLYAKLRAKNPAPFGAYVELLPLDPNTPQAILSTSPERFLTISQNEWLEMRPIKGTLIRPGWSKGEEDWLVRAATEPEIQKHVEAEDERRKAKLRADPKERAENLMIADLIRADLQAVCYPGSVQVPRLIALETYETVHQLVTAVVGKLRPGIGCVEATKRCFPPGSMTGAPKRRSVELLEHLEYSPSHSPSDTTRRRCAYSGALGFMGVNGASNLSVVIRTVTAQGSNVIVGAGGAVTILSTAQGEWDEVLTKLSSVASLAEP
ncbi:aminodeoxychorismate synthase [Malassezia brasiliensis]|uniref:aminodeoxychorismate synthase n=1 Tax=Malassezia brasiliensis TaxID=1821822 RepID=A0AAF0DWL1_9BASI|nr:aminodeoxychorismate synthase [Malassezia brasiliensis]